MKYFPLDNIQVCFICTGEHPTENCPSLPRLQEKFKGEKEELVFYIAHKNPWPPRDLGMMQDPTPQFSTNAKKNS